MEAYNNCVRERGTLWERRYEHFRDRVLYHRNFLSYFILVVLILVFCALSILFKFAFWMLKKGIGFPLFLYDKLKEKQL